MTGARHQENGLGKGIQSVLAGVMVLLISWVGFTLQSLKESQAINNTSSAVLSEKVTSLTKQLDKFTAQPRFSKEDFKAEMKPIEQRLKLTELELNKRTIFMGEVEDRLRKLERNLNQYEE